MPLGVKIPGSHRRSKSSSHDDHHRHSSPVSVGTPSPASPMITVNDQPLPQSILKNSGMSVSSDTGGSMSSGSGFRNGLSRLSLGDMPRSDTVDSRWTVDEPLSPGPGNGGPISPVISPTSSSNTSMTGMCPLPESTPGNHFPFFSMSLSSTSTLSFIALPSHLRPAVIDAIRRAWRHGIRSMDSVDYAPELMKFHKSKGCDGGVWEVTMKNSCWMPSSEDKVASKRIILYLLNEFARAGYELSTSYRMSAKDSGKDTLVFSQCEPDPDPVFFGVAFYSSDRIWIIDAEADVGQALEEGIKATWIDGVKAARVRQRHCRELKLAGNPWTAHSKTAQISARIIHLTIMKYITHRSLGYELAGAVNMADLDSGELPVTFYRRTGRGEWGTLDQLPSPVPLSKAAEKSMSIGV